jgi:hypothetical protein
MAPSRSGSLAFPQLSHFSGKIDIRNHQQRRSKTLD